MIFIGPPGVGKTHLAIGIGLKAIERGYKVLFTTALGLVEALELAELEGELKSKTCAEPVEASTPCSSSTCSSSTNKDFTAWGEFFADDNVAVPIVDRVIHHSHIFMLGGESYRLRQKLYG